MKNKNTAKRSWVETQAEYSQREFEDKAGELVWQLTAGGGIENCHVLDTLRALESAYLACAAYRMAARDEKA